MSGSCLFCKIIKGDIPSFKLVETAKSYAFLDIGPLSKGHALVIPKVPHHMRGSSCDSHSSIGARYEVARTE